MLINYIKIILRNIKKRKTYWFINVFGLAIGMACSLLILLYVYEELSFDQYHENENQIYRLILEQHSSDKITLNPSTPPPLASALANDFPQIEHMVRFLSFDNPIPMVSFEENQFYENKFYFADPNVFDVFTMPFIRGDSKTALQNPNTIVITEAISLKYFGDTDPVGKTITLNNYIDFQVTGVIRGMPSNSSIQIDFIASFSTLYGWLGKNFVDNWQNHMCQTFILLADGHASETIAHQIPGFIHKHLGENHTIKQVHFQPLSRLHLYTYQDYDLSSSGDIRYVYLLSAIAFLILIIACFNFMNLTTARSIERSKEVGIRKVAGADKKELVKQFLSESIVLTGFALLLAILFIELISPYFIMLIGREISTNYLQNWTLIVGLVCIGLFTSLLSGSYPAFILSNLPPVDSIKGKLKIGFSKFSIKKILVIFQFTITVMLIISTIVIDNQLEFIQNKKLGFDKDRLIVIPIREEYLRQNPESLKNRLSQNPDILNVSTAALFPGGPVGKTRYITEGIKNEGMMSMLWIDHDFVQTLGMDVIAGRDFSKEFQMDATNGFILNEAAVQQVGYSDPADAIGRKFELAGGKKGTIIGVTRNFNFTSLHRKIDPLVMHIWPWPNYIIARVSSNNLPGTIDNIKNICQTFDPDHPFTYSLLSDQFDRFYKSEKQFGKVSQYFSLIAIVIACLGLFGLSVFTAEQKTKEIGIRKTLGASVIRIVSLLSKDYIKWILIANLIAWPIAYFFLQNWLNNFAYRIDIELSAFTIGAILTLFIALATISFQSIKTALVNPIDSLKNE